MDTIAIAQMASAMRSSFGVSLATYNKEQGSICACDGKTMQCEYLFEHSELAAIMANNDANEEAYFYSNSVNCFWHVFSVTVENKPIVYVTGPVHIYSISEKQIELYFRQRGFAPEMVQALTCEYSKIPVMAYTLFVQIVSLIFGFICGVAPSSKELGVLSRDINDYQFKINDEVICKIQQRDFAMSIKNENFLRDCIKSGDVERLKVINNDDPKIINSSPLAQNELRSVKNNLVAFVALITRFAIEGGLPVETAFPLSDMFIMRIELANDLASTLKASSGAALEFASRVKENRFKMQYSALVNKCCGYIVSHVNMPIKVSEIAKITRIHPDTLERRFKKDTGISISQYIRNVKMDEAKMLLKYTQKSLTEICFDLGYASQSQFILNFKKCFGTTPNYYRNSNSF